MKPESFKRAVIIVGWFTLGFLGGVCYASIRFQNWLNEHDWILRK